MTRTSLLLLGLSLTLTLSAGASADKLIRDGDRVLFLGDSITHAGYYVALIEARLRELDPDTVPAMVNIGLPSETCSGLSEPDHPFPRPDVHERLDRALAKVKPTLVFACYGMNDGIYYPFGEDRFEAYQSGIDRLIEKVHAADARLVLMTPPPFDADPVRADGKLRPLGAEKYAWFAPYEGYDDVIQRYGQWIMEQHERVEGIVDLHTPLTEYTAERRNDDPKFTVAPDGVHANNEGHRVMARAILKAIGLGDELPSNKELIQLVVRRERLLHNSWLSHVRHKRPGMKPGPPLNEAQQQATEIDEQIRKLLKPDANESSRGNSLRRQVFVATQLPVPTPQAPTTPPVATTPASTKTNPLLDILDVDGDGALNAAEFESASALLKQLDGNSDGELSADELATPALAAPTGVGPPGHQRYLIVERFDTDENGRLNCDERAVARIYVKKVREAFFANMARQRRRGGRRGNRRQVATPEPQRGESVSPDDVESYADADLYDESVLRTFFLDFKADDWEAELADFYRTDVEVPATLTVDGKKYKKVGVRFRGNSSYFGVAAGKKRPLNLRLDYDKKKLDLYGYRTLNLLNGHFDPSFLRTVLYNHIARNYIPAPKANFVKLVINGENWGIYVNEQQFNKDFTEEWFGSRDGVRWKVPTPSFWGSLTNNGVGRDKYTGFELKSKDTDEAYAGLAHLCKALNETPIEKLDTDLNTILDVDRALWFLALDNVLVDTDGYYARGSDYLMYQEPGFGRFNILPYDNNETFRAAWSWTATPNATTPQAGAGVATATSPQGTWNTDGLDLSPFAGTANQYLPLVHRLLQNPRLRARYVAHVRTIVNDWLDWDKIGPVIEGYRELIDAEVQADTRKLYSYEGFANSVEEEYGTGARAIPGLRRFVTQRREFLLKRPELAQPAPAIASVEHVQSAATSNATQTIRAAVGEGARVGWMVLRYSTAPHAPYQAVLMQLGTDDIYAADIPAQPDGTQVSYYLEAIAYDKAGTAAFFPTTAEGHPLTYRVTDEQVTARADGRP